MLPISPEAENLLRQLLAFGNALNQAKDAGLSRIQSQLFVRSGWEVPDDTDTGISFGAGLEIGAGYMEMDLRDIRVPSFPQNYQSRGLYSEIGIGIGEVSKAQKLIEKIVSVLPKKARPSSDLVVMPGGSMTQFILGPNQVRSGLKAEDFKLASFIYVHVGAEVAVLAGDIGLMFMVDRTAYPQLVAAMESRNVFTALQGLLAACIAWAPYFGTSVGLGAGGKVAIRGIQALSLQHV